MPPNVSSLGFIITKWILIVVFMTCTLLVIVTGIVSIIYGIGFIREVSQFDKINGGMLITWGLFSSVYGATMYYMIKNYIPDDWIEPFLIISILIVVIHLILGCTGIKIGSSRINKNVVHYLQLLYRDHNQYSRQTITAIQQTYECCGLFSNRSYILEKNGSINWSCCQNGKPNAGCMTNESYQVGCEIPVSQVHNSAVYNLGSIFIAHGTVYVVMVILIFYFQNVYTNRPDY